MRLEVRHLRQRSRFAFCGSRFEPWLRVVLTFLVLAILLMTSSSLIGGEAGMASAADKKAATRVYSVAAMGDSLTDPRSQGGKYLAKLRKRCPQSRFDSYGIGGQMVNQMRRRFLRDVFGQAGKVVLRKPHYTHVLVLGGINDICSDETAKRTNDKIKRDLLTMYRAASERGSLVVALTLPPWGGFTRYYNPRRAASTRELNAWIRAQVKKPFVDQVVDLYPKLSCGDTERLCERYAWPDQVHWNKAGHAVVGELLYRELFSDCR